MLETLFAALIGTGCAVSENSKRNKFINNQAIQLMADANKSYNNSLREQLRRISENEWPTSISELETSWHFIKRELAWAKDAWEFKHGNGHFQMEPDVKALYDKGKSRFENAYQAEERWNALIRSGMMENRDNEYLWDLKSKAYDDLQKYNISFKMDIDLTFDFPSEF